MVARLQSESARRVSGCVTALLRRQPFFGSLALRLPLRADPTRETLASDGREIRYAPQWIAQTDAHVIETAIARVVLACALKHHTRREERDPERWQLASQLVTHSLLRDAGFTLPPDAEAWEGMSVEQAYDRLPEPEQAGPDSDGDTSPGSGDAGGAGQGAAGDPPDSGNGNDANNPSDPVEAAPQPDDPGQGGSDDASPSCDPSGTGEVMDTPVAGSGADDGSPAPSASQLAAEEQAWDEAMHQAASLARAEGKLPGSVEETVRGAHASTLDWRSLLRRYITDAAKSDYSWSLPNRRFIDSGFYLPSIRSEGIEAIAVIVDTSGSVDADALAAFWSEVREVATEIRPERVIILQVDAALRDAAEFPPDYLPDEIIVRGRGGTDFRPGFEWLDGQGIRPGVCLYFTDMECDRYPEAEPPYPVLWCDYGDSDSPWRHPAPPGASASTSPPDSAPRQAKPTSSICIPVDARNGLPPSATLWTKLDRYSRR